MARYLSRETLGQIAERVLCAYKKLPEVQERGFYSVDTSLLVKELLRLNVEYRHLSKDRLTLGMTCFEEIGIELSDTNIQLKSENLCGRFCAMLRWAS